VDKWQIRKEWDKRLIEILRKDEPFICEKARWVAVTEILARILERLNEGKPIKEPAIIRKEDNSTKD